MSDNRTPPWAYPLAAMIFIVWSFACIGAGMEAGYAKAVNESESVRYFVSHEMKDIGFCRWLEISRFPEDCVNHSEGDEQ